MSTTPSRLRKPTPVRVLPVFPVPSTPLSLLRRPNSAPLPDEMTTPRNGGNPPSHAQLTRSASADNNEDRQKLRSSPAPPTPGLRQRRKSFSTPQNTMGGRDVRPTTPLPRRAPPSPVMTPSSAPKNEEITIRGRNQKLLVPPSPGPQIEHEEKSQKSEPVTQPAAVASKSEADFWKEKFEKERAECILLERAIDARRREVNDQVEEALIRRAMNLKRLDDKIVENRAIIDRLVNSRQDNPRAMNNRNTRRAIQRYEETITWAQKEIGKFEDTYKKQLLKKGDGSYAAWDTAKQLLKKGDGSHAAWDTAVRPEREQSDGEQNNRLNLL